MTFRRATGISAPLDTTIFLIVANLAIPGIFTMSTFATSIASKLFGAYVVYRILKHRERKFARVDPTQIRD